MTLLKTKQIIFLLGHLSGLPTHRVFTRQTMREKRVFVYFCHSPPRDSPPEDPRRPGVRAGLKTDVVFLMLNKLCCK